MCQLKTDFRIPQGEFRRINFEFQFVDASIQRLGFQLDQQVTQFHVVTMSGRLFDFQFVPLLKCDAHLMHLVGQEKAVQFDACLGRRCRRRRLIASSRAVNRGWHGPAGLLACERQLNGLEDGQEREHAGNGLMLHR